MAKNARSKSTKLDFSARPGQTYSCSALGEKMFLDSRLRTSYDPIKIGRRLAIRHAVED
jgi:hypothetical protein